MEVRRRVLRALMIVPLVLACVAGVARAEVYYNDTGTEYQGLIAGYEYSELGRHRATMEYLGFDWDSIGSVQQARLRTNSNGKNPYMAVYDLCENIQYEWNGGVFDWPIFNVWAGIFGMSNMWLVGGVNAEDYEVARNYVLGVITGTSTGGGGGESTEFGSTLTATDKGITYSWNGTAVADYHAGTINGILVRPFTVTNGTVTYPATLPDIELNINTTQFEELTGSGCKAYILAKPSYKGSSPYQLQSFRFYIYVTDITPTVEEKTATYSGQTFSYKKYTFTVTEGSTFYYNENVAGTLGEGLSYTITNLKLSQGSAGRTFTFNTSENNGPDNYWINFGESVPVNPPEPAPEPDPPTVAPTPPEQPTYVFEPVIGVDFPTITIETDPVSDEVIDWLKLIHRDLSRISQEMNDYIEDASNAIVAAINNQGAALRRWFDTLSTQINDVYTYLVTMQERYLNELDRDLVSWLKRIYSRLGGNGAAEPDPNEDERGFWDWILEQLQKFFVGNVDDAADGIKGLLQQLTEFFPFSLPWDLMALFGLFAAEPVTPVFDVQLPVPAVVSADYGETLHIDLHQWDGTMNIVRDLETIFFAAWLISMVPTWLNDIKVGDM